MEKLVFRDGQTELLSPAYISQQEVVVEVMEKFAADMPPDKFPRESVEGFKMFVEGIRQTHAGVDWSKSRAERMRVVLDRALAAIERIDARVQSDVRVLN